MDAPLPWFPHWLLRHLKRHPGAGLPEPTENPELYEAWGHELHRLHITEERADEASRRMVSRGKSRNHFADLCRVALGEPKATKAEELKPTGPDYSKPESLTPEQRRERIRLIRSELPAIEHSAELFPSNPWYALSAEMGRSELNSLLEMSREHHRTSQPARRAAF